MANDPICHFSRHILCLSLRLCNNAALLKPHFCGSKVPRVCCLLKPLHFYVLFYWSNFLSKSIYKWFFSHWMTMANGHACLKSLKLNKFTLLEFIIVASTNAMHRFHVTFTPSCIICRPYICPSVNGIFFFPCILPNIKQNFICYKNSLNRKL